MANRSVSPKMHLMIDFLLFILLGMVGFSTLLEHTASPDRVHLRFMLHAIHGIAGIAIGLVVSVHLYLHLPWIRFQLRRLFQR